MYQEEKSLQCVEALVWLTATCPSFSTDDHLEIFTQSSCPSSDAKCKAIQILPLNWMLCGTHMIKPPTYTVVLCFLLSFKKMLPSWSTAPGHTRGQSLLWQRSAELQHNGGGLSNTVRLLVHVLKPHPAHLLRSSPPINYTALGAVLPLHRREHTASASDTLQACLTVVYYNVM